MASPLDPYKVLPGRVTNDEIREALDNVSDVLLGTSVEAGLNARYAPRSRPNVCVVVGDSIMAGSGVGMAWIDWLAALSGGKLVRMLNAGATGGNTSSIMLSGFTENVVDKSPDYVVIGGVTPNDVAGHTVATSIANILAMVEAAEAASIRPILVNNPPSDTTATRDYMEQVGTWVTRYAQQNGIPLIDVNSPLVDGSDGGYTASLTIDGTHPNAEGVRAVVDYNLPRLPPELVYYPSLAQWNSDANNEATNGLFLTDSNVDGLADGWTKAGTATTSLAAVGAGLGLGNWQLLTAADTAATQIYRDIAVTAGHDYEFAMRFRTDGGGRPRIRLSGLWDFGGDYKDIGEITEADGCIVIGRWTAAATGNQRFFLGLSGEIGQVGFAQFTVRDLTAIDDYA